MYITLQITQYHPNVDVLSILADRNCVILLLWKSICFFRARNGNIRTNMFFSNTQMSFIEFPFICNQIMSRSERFWYQHATISVYMYFTSTNQSHFIRTLIQFQFPGNWNVRTKHVFQKHADELHRMSIKNILFAFILCILFHILIFFGIDQQNIGVYVDFTLATRSQLLGALQYAYQ